MRKTATATLFALILGVFLVAVPSPAHADPPCDLCEVDNGGAGAGNQEPGSADPGSGDTDPGTTGGTGPVYTGPFKQYRYVVSCPYNSLDNAGDVLCMGAVESCPDEGDLRYRVYYRLVDRSGNLVDGPDWVSAGSECRGLDDPTTGVVQPEVTREMVIEEAYRLAPKPTVHVEPATKSYVNVPNNFYADAQDASHTVNLLGESITIAFQVEEVSWTFGDGEGASGAGVQNAAVGAPGAVEHQYAGGGSYDITATTSITVQFTLPSGQQVTVPDAIDQTSSPVPLDVGEIQTTVNDVG